MIRLGALMLATIAGLFLILSIWGDGDLRASRRPAPQPQPAATDAGAGPPPVEPVASAPAVLEPVVQAATQTPQQVQRYPGPALRPSPEHGARTPEPAVVAGGGPVMYVTGNRVNVRAGPSTGDRVVTALRRGAAVAALGPADAEWVNIRDADGRVGYVSARFLSSSPP